MSQGFGNPPAAELRRLLRTVRTIAVVGLSPHPARPSHMVAESLQRFGYRIIPIRPGVGRILDEPAYGHLSAVPERIDLVNVFRAPEHVDAIIDDCLALRIPAVWLQDGVINVRAAERARAAGCVTVMDRCILRDYRQLLGSQAVG